LRRRGLRWWRRSVRIAISAVRVLVARSPFRLLFGRLFGMPLALAFSLFALAFGLGRFVFALRIAGIRVLRSHWRCCSRSDFVLACSFRLPATMRSYCGFHLRFGVVVVVMADRFGRFALFRRATDVNGHSLPALTTSPARGS